jgi:ABC-type transport system substrate-binding protein
MANHRQRVSWQVLVLIGIYLFLMASCERTEIPNKKSETQASVNQLVLTTGGTYRLPLMSNPVTLDPHYAQDEYGLRVAHQIFSGLVQLDHQLMILPDLAENWEISDNGKNYKFHLRKNAKFHNGHPVTADDVIFSFRRLLRIDPPPIILPHLLKIAGAEEIRAGKNDIDDGFKAEGQQVLNIRLIEPHALFLTALGMSQVKIVPKDEVMNSGDQFGQHPIGSGPFRFVDWTANEQIRLSRYDDYFGGPAHLDGIHCKIYPGTGIENTLNDFLAGKLEEMPLYVTFREKLAVKPDLQYVHRPSLSIHFYGIRVEHPYLRNANFRKALSLSIDRDQLVENVYDGDLSAARAIIPPGMPGFKWDRTLFKKDMPQARSCLEKAVKSESGPIPRLEIVSTSQSEYAQAEMGAIKKSWSELGIEVELKYITDWTQFKQYLRSDKVQIFRYVWFADIPDPDNFLFPLFASDSPANFMHYKNAQVDEKLSTAIELIDTTQRMEIYRQLEVDILEAMPIIPLFFYNVDQVFQPYVQDAKISALGVVLTSFSKIWLKTDSP